MSDSYFRALDEKAFDPQHFAAMLAAGFTALRGRNIF